MKTTLHIITGLGHGGAQAVLYRLCTHDRAHTHYVISMTDGGKYSALLSEAGIETASLGMSRGRVSLAGLWRMWRIIRSKRPDAVQTWMYHANLIGGVVARLAGRSNVCWGIRQSTLDPDLTARSTILVDRTSALLSRLIPRLIVCCAEAAREVHSETGYDRKRMIVIPNGYDLSSFRPDSAAGAAVRAELGITATELVVGFVARFHPFKDHANLLRALVFLREAGVSPLCLLAGDGVDSANAALVNAIAGHGLSGQVRLLGPRSDVPAVMNALDLHVMSSVTEGFPNVLAEAMACGTPCVSTDVGDASEIVGATGKVVRPRDPAALAEAIDEMLAERGGPDWPARQDAARRRIAGHYSVGRMTERYHAAWSGTLAPGTSKERGFSVSEGIS